MASSPAEYRATPPARVRTMAYVRLAVGVVTAALAFALCPRDAWAALLVSVVYFAGLAQGMVMWSVVLYTAKATWSPAVSRLGQAAIGFLPITLVAVIVLLLGRDHWLTWLHHPVPEKAAWLNVPFMVARSVGGLLLLTIACAVFVRIHIRLSQRIADGDEPDMEQTLCRLTGFSVGLCLLYVVVSTLFSLDFVMSLSPHWYSTMFPLHFLVSNLYIGMAAIVLHAVILGDRLGAGRWLSAPQYCDMGNLLLGFGLFCAGLQFAQALTIWYESLPEEAPFMVLHLYEWPWRPLSFLVLCGGYLGPFAALLFPRVKRSPVALAGVSALILICLFVERMVMVAPSLDPAGPPNLLVLLGMAVGFTGVLVLVTLRFLDRVPSVGEFDVRLRDLVREVTTG